MSVYYVFWEIMNYTICRLCIVFTFLQAYSDTSVSSSNLSILTLTGDAWWEMETPKRFCFFFVNMFFYDLWVSQLLYPSFLISLFSYIFSNSINTRTLFMNYNYWLSLTLGCILSIYLFGLKWTHLEGYRGLRLLWDLTGWKRGIAGHGRT